MTQPGPLREAGRAKVVALSKQKRGQLIPAPGLPATAVIAPYPRWPPPLAPRYLEDHLRRRGWLPQHSAPRQRLRVLAERLHRLGPRATYELFLELATLFGPEVVTRLEAYARTDPALLRVVGGDRFPPRLVAIKGSRL